MFIIPAQILTLGALSYYDPCVRWDQAAGKWRVAAIETDTRTAWTVNYPVLFEGTSLTSLTRIAGDSANNFHDGAQWAKIGGTWYVIYGGTTGFVSYSESLGDRTVLTNWSNNIPSGVFNSFGSYPPHAALLAVADEGFTRYLALCYGADTNNTNSRGSLVVLEANEKPTGYEFGRRSLARRV